MAHRPGSPCRDGYCQCLPDLAGHAWLGRHAEDHLNNGVQPPALGLRVDQMDLPLLRRPAPTSFDLTVGGFSALEERVADGAVRAIGGITACRGTGTRTFDDPAIVAVAAAHGCAGLPHLEPAATVPDGYLPRGGKPGRHDDSGLHHALHERLGDDRAGVRGLVSWGGRPRRDPWKSRTSQKPSCRGGSKRYDSQVRQFALRARCRALPFFS